MNEEKIYTVSEFETVDLGAILSVVPRKKGERKKKNSKQYWNIICAFDIETTTVKDPEGVTVDGEVITIEGSHSFMYVWQCQIGDDYTIMGRTWEEYGQLLKCLRKAQHEAMKRLHILQPVYFVFFVHNLAYEWQFLQGLFKFENDDCFFRDIRKPIYCRHLSLIEYRCSYLHSNMSLEKFGENMGCTVKKLDGSKYGYKKIRYPWTELSDYEIKYCVNDVRTLVEAITIECQRDGDTLISLPLTSTGYVRRDCKKAIAPVKYSISQMLPDLDTYNLLRRCFRGGDTHANRYRVKEIQAAGNCFDIESSYPYALCTGLYPMGPFRLLGETGDKIPELERVIKLISAGNAVIGDYHFKGLRLKSAADPMPYLPISKCQTLRAITDNGRIISADMCVVGLTEIDLQIVIEQYDFYSVKVYNARTAIKGPLPKAYRQVVIDYYTKKTQLKKVQGKEYEYTKSKNKLNSCYGMAAQQSIHPRIVYEDHDYLCYTPSGDDAETELKTAPFPYQWGVYCTAIARQNLRKGMSMIPKDEHGISRIIYCDTDSIKYVGAKVDFTSLNNRIRQTSIKAGAIAYDKNGQMHYMGMWDEEPPFKRFVTLGAKRYAYEDYDNKLHVTVSGVTKKPHVYEDGHEELYAAEELGSLENFTEGMLWKEAGGTAAEYNDTDNFYIVDPQTGNKVHVTPNVSIVDTTYTMTVENDYREMVDNAIYWLRYCEEKGRSYK